MPFGNPTNPSGAASSGAPVDATYVVGAANGTLTAELLLSAVIGRGALASRPAAGTAGRLYFDTDSNILYRDNGTIWDSVEGVSSGGNVYDPTIIYEQDNFLSGNATSGQVGKLGWVWSGASLTMLASEAGRPGIVRGVTAATNPSNGAFHVRATASAGIILPADQPWEIGWMVRPRLNGGAAGSTVIRVGMSNDPTTGTTPSNGVYFEKLDTDTNWFFVTRSGAAETRTNTGVAFADDTFVRFRIRRESTSGNMIGQINAGTDISHSATLTTTALLPFCSMRTVEAVAKHIDAKLFYMRLTGLSGLNLT